MTPESQIQDMVNHPPHYTRGPKGIECIDITEHMDFCLGNAQKYIWRVAFGGKQDTDPIEDLRKSIWYIEREIKKLLEKGDRRTGGPEVKYATYNQIRNEIDSAAKELFGQDSDIFERERAGQ